MRVRVPMWLPGACNAAAWLGSSSCVRAHLACAGGEVGVAHAPTRARTVAAWLAGLGRYVLLPGWDASDPEQQRLMAQHLYGNGAARTPTVAEDLAMFESAGFRVEEHYDFANLGHQIYGDEAVPWWGDLQPNWYFSLLPAHPWVRRPLPALLRVLAWLGLVPADVPRVAELMNEGGDGLSGLGKLNAITPQYYVLAVKPEA